MKFSKKFVNKINLSNGKTTTKNKAIGNALVPFNIRIIKQKTPIILARNFKNLI
jgi:hypothetical protein